MTSRQVHKNVEDSGAAYHRQQNTVEDQPEDQEQKKAGKNVTCAIIETCQQAASTVPRPACKQQQWQQQPLQSLLAYTMRSRGLPNALARTSHLYTSIVHAIASENSLSRTAACCHLLLLIQVQRAPHMHWQPSSAGMQCDSKA
jgi:hypothetical protein